MVTPSRKLSISILNNEYEISFPNVGESIDIEVLKLKITNDKFEVLKYSLNPQFVQAALNAEAVATFNILIPKLKKDLTITSMLDLTQEQMKVFVAAYTDVYLPWYEEWLTVLNKPVSEPAPEEKAA